MSDQDSLVFKDLSGLKSETYIYTGYILSRVPATITTMLHLWKSKGLRWNRKRQLEASHVTLELANCQLSM